MAGGTLFGCAVQAEFNAREDVAGAEGDDGGQGEGEAGNAGALACNAAERRNGANHPRLAEDKGVRGAVDVVERVDQWGRRGSEFQL